VRARKKREEGEAVVPSSSKNEEKRKDEISSKHSELRPVLCPPSIIIRLFTFEP
jgi:hypothetical protein